MHVASYLALVVRSETNLATAFREVAQKHMDEPDVMVTCRSLAGQCDEHASRLEPFAGDYGKDTNDEPQRLHSELFGGPRSGGLGLLRDLHDLYLMACEVDISWVVLEQAAQGLRDKALHEVIQACDKQTNMQRSWILTRMKQAAPQTLIAAD